MIFYPSDECQVNDDCPLNKECFNNECSNPCNRVICGSRAECKPEFHQGICYCPLGLQGNPQIACTEVGCQSHDDCSPREKCDYLNANSGRKECQPLCVNGGPCHQFATCSAENHQEICTCNPPYQGDGYVTCFKGDCFVVTRNELPILLLSRILKITRLFFQWKFPTSQSVG